MSLIVLEAPGFVVRGSKEGKDGWWEFAVDAGDAFVGPVGGQRKDLFSRELLAILERTEGKKLALIPNAPFNKQVGGDTSEYLGSVAWAGYHTLYFFRDSSQLTRIALATGSGELLAQTSLDSAELGEWRRRVREWQ